ncbi:MAG: metalloprotease [Salegentibacter sp.]
MRYFSGFLLFLCCTCGCFGQKSLNISAQLDEENHFLHIQEDIHYENSSDSELNEIYLNDWINAFSSKITPLARRFSEEYMRRFHFASEEERGGTSIYYIRSQQGEDLHWNRPLLHPDIVKIDLQKPLKPGESVDLKLNYTVHIPSEKFTRYGVDPQNNFKLRYWYMTPAVFDKEWKLYSNKNLNDEFTPPADLKITLHMPSNYYVASALKVIDTKTINGFKSVELEGKNRVSEKLYLTHTYIFERIETDQHDILTNVEENDLQPAIRNLILDRILKFLEKRLGPYPHHSLFVTREDYLGSPIYGLNQLPGFIRPFPDGFQYDIKQLKTITNYYLQNTLLLNPRKEQWVNDAILVSLMMDYVDTYYPKMKLIGNLSDVIGVRWFHAADLEFNDQYQFLYMNSARLNLEQSLITPRDSLIKFNTNIANAYKAGVGLKYLENFLSTNAVNKSISEFYHEKKLQPVSEQDFREVLKKNADKNISWFFKDYVETNQKIDFKIQNLKKTPDSLYVTIKNRAKNGLPVSLYGLNDGNIVYKTWVEDVDSLTTVRIPRKNIQRLALNYEQKIPEFNQRNNYKGVTTLLDKPLQFRLLQDVEDPRYTQLFFMPEFDYNLYDGLSIGPKVYNKTILAKNFNFKIAPKYGFTSKTVVGSAFLAYTQQFQNQELYAINYGISGNRFSYGYNLFYEKYTPFLSFSFRNKYLRDNERQSLVIRSVNVRRDIDPLKPVNQPNYGVFDVHYRYSNPHLADYSSASFDYQLAKKFSKVSFSLEYRKLFRNNRQINFRMYAGTFLYSDTEDTDYFSFALDRPTDYLFDYNYYGRSQGSGLFSQQIIMAEGGFKSKLEPAYANQWLISLNGSTNLWRWIFAYSDVGLVKNKNHDAVPLFDSGLRVSLVEDYFEVFFPVYSSLGWEVAQPNYDQKIRFIVSLDLNTLIKLFTRRWY